MMELLELLYITIAAIREIVADIRELRPWDRRINDLGFFVSDYTTLSVGGDDIVWTREAKGDFYIEAMGTGSGGIGFTDGELYVVSNGNVAASVAMNCLIYTIEEVKIIVPPGTVELRLRGTGGFGYSWAMRGFERFPKTQGEDS